MAIYNLYGAQLSDCFGKDGDPLTEAFNTNGVEIFRKQSIITVMSYNVQKFGGINAQGAMQNEIINRYKPDIIGMQELGSVTTLPTVGQNMLSPYSVKQLSNHNNKLMLVTKGYLLSNLVIADFQNQDPEDMARYNETRAYMKADIEIGGKMVTLINTHLCYLTSSIQYAQMQELYEIAESCERVIITGDFNSHQTAIDDDDYLNMYKPFVMAGYHLANNSPESGFTRTYTKASTATSLADFTTAPDTIIVSNNIDITDVTFDITKLSYLNGNAIDHIPVIATLRLS